MEIEKKRAGFLFTLKQFHSSEYGRPSSRCKLSLSTPISASFESTFPRTSSSGSTSINSLKREREKFADRRRNRNWFSGPRLGLLHTMFLSLDRERRIWSAHVSEEQQRGVSGRRK